MKVVIQRVNSASVQVENKTIGQINKGLLIFLGISKNYTKEKLNWIINKILKLRLWKSDRKGFDLSVKDINGEILIVSQFTLHGDCTNSSKPNFAKSCEYEKAEKIYNQFINKLKESKLNIQTGQFGAIMQVNLENDGPVTIILEK